MKIKFVLLATIIVAISVVAADSQWKTGKLIDMRSEATGAGYGRAQFSYCMAVQFDDLTYISEYEGTWRHSYEPTDFVVGDTIQARISGHDLYLKKPSGGELKMLVMRRERNEADKPPTTCAVPVQQQSYR